MWFALRAHFAPLAERGFHVVAPDQRGYNLSSKPEGADAYKLDLAAADVFALASALGRERFHVAGHDWGAAVVWTMAGLRTQAPHQRDDDPGAPSRPLAQGDAGGSGAADEEPLRADPASALAVGDGVSSSATSRAWRGPSGPRRGRRPLPARRSTSIAAAWRQPGALTGMLNWYRALYVDEPATPAAASLIPPTLVLWGDRDEFAVPTLADESAKLCANARLRHLPQATHWIIHDAPDLVRDALLDHL